MAWQESRGPSRGLQPTASVRRSAQLGFNNGAVDRYKLAQYSYALLYYDSAERKIGIRLLAEKAPRAYKFVHRVGDAFISAKTLFDEFEIPLPDKTKKYDLTWSEENELLVMDLTAPRQTRREQSGN